MNILIVEDDIELVTTLRIGFEEAGYEVQIARSAEKALDLLEKTRFDCALLDIELPGQDGLAVLKHVRGGARPIPSLIMTGGRTDVADRVHGLNLGADDYLLKPFTFNELLARVRAVMRRASGQDALSMQVGDLEIDLTSHHVRRAGQDIELTQREFRLLEYLARRENQVVTTEMIAEDVWKESRRATPLDNVINVHISHLRKKVDKDFDSKLIHTVRGEGFRMSAGT